MKLTERIRNVLKKTWSEAPSAASRDLLALYHTNPRLDGVRIIANKCASTEMYLYNRAEYRVNKNKAEIIAEHPLYELLENPCPTFRDITGWTIRYFVFACYKLVGEAYLLKIRNEKGVVISLLPISPSWVVKTPTITANYWEIYPYGTTASNSVNVPVEDVICFKDIDLLDPYGRGRGTSEAIGDEIQSDEYAAKFAKNLFYNNATPDAIIYAPGGNKDTAEQIKQTWRQKMAGIRHAHDIMVLTGENTKFEKVSDSPKELDFVESRRYLRDVANQQYHIPPEIFGILENSNRSTIDSAFYLLNKNVLADDLRMFERVMNTQLLWEDFDRSRELCFKHENTIEEDITQKLQIANDGLSRGVLTVNDWRIAMGFERDEHGGDVYLRGMTTEEVPFDSQNVELPDLPTEEPETVELPETQGEAEQEADNLIDDQNNVQEQENGKTFEKALKDYRAKHTVIVADEKEEQRRVAIWKQFDARATSIEEPFIKQSQKAFKAQNKLVNKAITEAVENNKDVLTAVERIYNNDMDVALKRTLAPAFIIGLNEGAKIGLERLDKKAYKDLDEVQEWLNAWIDSYGLALCADMNQTTKKKLKKVLSESIEEGDTLSERVKKLCAASDALFVDMGKVRAALIARTESCTTMNAGSNLLYKSEGIEQKLWISARDDRTRDAHLIMDGTVIGIDEKFDVPGFDSVEGAMMDYPGDATAPAGQVCNCRCVVSPFVRL